MGDRRPSNDIKSIVLNFREQIKEMALSHEHELEQEKAKAQGSLEKFHEDNERLIQENHDFKEKNEGLENTLKEERSKYGNPSLIKFID